MSVVSARASCHRDVTIILARASYILFIRRHALIIAILGICNERKEDWSASTGAISIMDGSGSGSGSSVDEMAQ